MFFHSIESNGERNLWRQENNQKKEQDRKTKLLLPVIRWDLVFLIVFLKVTIVSKQNQWHLFKVTGVSVHRPILRWIKNVVHLLVKMTTELMNLCVTSISNHSTISTVQKIWIWILGHVRRNSIAMCVFWSWYMVFIQWTRYRAHVNVCVCL